jgi:hypothetical protein
LLAVLQDEMDSINDGSHPVMKRKFAKADRERSEKRERAARRRDCTLEVAELGTKKEMDDIRDWWKVEAKRVKDEMYSKICDSVGVSLPRSASASLRLCLSVSLPLRACVCVCAYVRTSVRVRACVSVRVRACACARSLYATPLVCPPFGWPFQREA